MSKESIDFRIESEQRIALDELADAMQCDRTALINEAIETYLESHHWQVELINKRLATADEAPVTSQLNINHYFTDSLTAS